MMPVYEKTETVLVKMEHKNPKRGENGENLETNHKNFAQKISKGL